MATIAENMMPSRSPSLKQRIVFAEDPVRLRDQGFQGWLKIGKPSRYHTAHFLLFPFFRTTVVMYSVKGDIHTNTNGVKLRHRKYWWRTSGKNTHLVHYDGYTANIELSFRLPRHIAFPGMSLYLDDAVLFDPGVTNLKDMFHVPVILLGKDFFTKFPHLVAGFQTRHRARDVPQSAWSSGIPQKWYELPLTQNKEVMAHLEICNGSSILDSTVLGVGVYFEPHSAYNSFAGMDKYGPDGKAWETELLMMRAWLTGVSMIINAVANQCNIRRSPKLVIVNNRYGNLLSRLKPNALLDPALKGVGLDKILYYANREGNFTIDFPTIASPDMQWMGKTGEAVKTLAMAGTKMRMVTHDSGLNLLPSFNRFDLFEMFKSMMQIDPDGGRLWWNQHDYVYVGLDGVFRCTKSGAQEHVRRADDIGSYNKAKEEEEEEALLNFIELGL